jgi:hypothetical protein
MAKPKYKDLDEHDKKASKDYSRNLSMMKLLVKT